MMLLVNLLYEQLDVTQIVHTQSKSRIFIICGITVFMLK